MAKYVLGIDTGGTKIAGVVFDGQKVVKELTIVTPKSLADFKDSLKHLVNFLSVGHNISAVGMGIAGVVKQEQGIIVHSPNIPFLKNFNLKKFLKFGQIKRVAIDNDANCFALAERKIGEGK